VPDLAEPFVVDPQAAAHALLLAESAARHVLDLRGDCPVGELHIALFDATAEADDDALPDPRDAQAVLSYMEGRLIVDHGSGTDTVIDEVGLSKRQITRFKAFECVSSGVDAYEAILAQRKFDGATRSYGSHRFEQMTPGGSSRTLVAAASGWRAEQDYLVAITVAATLCWVLLEYGALPRAGIVSPEFLLADGAWEYPAT
jgi:hypothetical protein